MLKSAEAVVEQAPADTKRKLREKKVGGYWTS